MQQRQQRRTCADNGMPRVATILKIVNFIDVCLIKYACMNVTSGHPPNGGHP